MSSNIFDRLQDPIFAGSVVLFAIAGVGISLAIDNWFVGMFTGLLISGALYILYQDYVEKQRISAAEAAKEKDLDRRRAEQARAEQETGKCVSCLTELPNDVENCPKCGFAVRHYSTEKTEA